MINNTLIPDKLVKIIVWPDGSKHILVRGESFDLSPLFTEQEIKELLENDSLDS